MPSIRGDQDRRLVELDRTGTGATDRIDYMQLDRSHLDWLASLPPTIVYRDEVFLCHGTPRSDAAYWLDRVTDEATVQPSAIEHVEAEASGMTASLMLCGYAVIHTSHASCVCETVDSSSALAVLVARDTRTTDP